MLSRVFCLNVQHFLILWVPIYVIVNGRQGGHIYVTISTLLQGLKFGKLRFSVFQDVPLARDIAQNSVILWSLFTKTQVSGTISIIRSHSKLWSGSCKLLHIRQHGFVGIYLDILAGSSLRKHFPSHRLSFVIYFNRYSYPHPNDVFTNFVLTETLQYNVRATYACTLLSMHLYV